ncbi:type II secretion system protein N [Desulfurispirillum indicum]|uniref:Type II secretion system protein N n=1 Tax=Desulfurispirillum indicum (strain ATCC BAA-1389 / DSM 22839 / S5) TaxID=653733 RepID=E6W5J0_DESIS|nr:type II secretion system protein N [Desulfurispirillum indicum]ADU66021.1 hypothetical protein Selin_1286 [Desulfurispirillum indicum S5]UCZ57959.1 type II secretion system protein N [Desulfurispirillum indicum]
MLTKKRIFGIVLAFFLLYGFFLVTTIPAAYIWAKIPAQDTITLTRISGTLWNGNASLHYGPLPPLPVSWKISPRLLWQGKVLLAFRVQEGRTDIDLGIAAAPWGAVQLMASGRLDATTVQPLLQTLNLRVPGHLEIRRVHVNIHGDEIRQADGTLHWSGGLVESTQSGNAFTINMPVLVGNLSHEEQRAILRIGREGDDQPVGEISLGPDGWARLQIMSHLTRAIPLPWNIPGRAGSILFTYEEKVF